MQMSPASFTLIRALRGLAVGAEQHQHQPLIAQRYLSSRRRTLRMKTDMRTVAQALYRREFKGSHYREMFLCVIRGW